MGIWERQSGEEDEIYQLFSRYINMKPRRSVARVAEDSQKPIRRLYGLSKKWNWSERARAYDAFLNNISRELNLNDMKGSSKEESAILQKLAGSLSKLISRIEEKIDESDEEISKMKLADYLKIVAAYVKAVPDVRSAAEMLFDTGKGQAGRQEFEPIAELIKSDEKAQRLASELLERISEMG